MTTPETARTAARNRWIAEQVAMYDAAAVASGHASDEPRNFYNTVFRAKALAASLETAGLAPWSCLPEPQASKASEANSPEIPDSSAAPAGEAVSVARDVAQRWHTHGSYHSHNKADAEMVVAVGAALSAPPPSTGDKPTPPPAPASKGDAEYAGNLLAVIHGDGGHYITKHGWIKAVDDAKAKWYDMLARAESAPLSVAPAREGWQELLDMHASVVNMVPGQWSSKYPAPSYQVHATDDNGKRRAVCEALAGTSFERDAVMAYIAAAHNWLLAAARVTPPQQEEDRSWEKECEILANGVVSYPSTASTTGLVYLVPDGRWLTYDQWLILDPSLDRFPSEAAAFSALAKAPSPTT